MADLEDIAERGVSVKALENRPLTLPGLGFYLTAYTELCSDRPEGMTTGAIPWSSIINWCQFNGVCDIDEVATCMRYLRAMEQADRDFSARKSDK